jgi:uncharacterized YkwD family protein
MNFKTKKLIPVTLAIALISTSSVSASSPYTSSTYYNVCEQLGIKVCHSEDCTVGYKYYINNSCTTATESTTQATTNKPVIEASTETTTQAVTVTTEKPNTTNTEATTVKPTVEATTETTTQAPVTVPSGNTSYAQQVLDLVNAERSKNGLSPLTLDASVSKVAQLKAEDMKQNSYFSHTSPTYGSPFNMLKSFGISYKTAGENIAKGQKTPQAVVTAWMNSDSHRANILNKNFTKLGVGYANGSSPYWVQIFIG